MSTIESFAVLLALVVLFLGSGMWIFAGLILVGAGSIYFVLDFSLPRIGTIATKVISSSAVSWELAAISDFHLDGRHYFSDRHFSAVVPRPFAAGFARAGRAASYERVRLHGIRGDKRIQHRDDRDGRQDHDPGASPSRIRLEPGFGFACRSRKLRSPNSAVHRNDYLRGSRGGFHRKAVRRRAAAGHHDGRAIFGIHRNRRAAAPGHRPRRKAKTFHSWTS